MVELARRLQQAAMQVIGRREKPLFPTTQGTKITMQVDLLTINFPIFAPASLVMMLVLERSNSFVVSVDETCGRDILQYAGQPGENERTGAFTMC